MIPPDRRRAWLSKGGSGELMSKGTSCRSCGVALPGRVGRCPACGVRSGVGRLAVGAGLAIIAALALWIIVPHPRPRVDPSLAADVQAFTGLRRLSADEKRTEVSGFIENRGRVPVDVKVRVRALDVVGNVVADFESRPYGTSPPAVRRRSRPSWT